MIFHFGTSQLMCQNKLLGVVGGVLGRYTLLIFQKLFTGKSVFLINQFTFWNFSHVNTIKCIFASQFYHPSLYLLAGAKWLQPWHWGSSAHCLAQSAAVTTWLSKIISLSSSSLASWSSSSLPLFTIHTKSVLLIGQICIRQFLVELNSIYHQRRHHRDLGTPYFSVTPRSVWYIDIEYRLSIYRHFWKILISMKYRID